MRLDKEIGWLDFAELVGVSPQQVHLWEIGRTSMSVERIEKAAEVLGVAPSEIVGWSGEQNAGSGSEVSISKSS